MNQFLSVNYNHTSNNNYKLSIVKAKKDNEQNLFGIFTLAYGNKIVEEKNSDLINLIHQIYFNNWWRKNNFEFRDKNPISEIYDNILKINQFLITLNLENIEGSLALVFLFKNVLFIFYTGTATVLRIRDNSSLKVLTPNTDSKQTLGNDNCKIFCTQATVKENDRIFILNKSLLRILTDEDYELLFDKEFKSITNSIIELAEKEEVDGKCLSIQF